MSKYLSPNKSNVSLTILMLTIVLMATACSTLARASSIIHPVIVINSPANNSQFREGDQVAVQSTSTDPSSIIRVELAVDSIVVRTDPFTQPQSTAIIVQNWTATPGAHTITVRAVNGDDAVSEPASIAISVTPVITPTTAPRVITATPLPPVLVVTATPPLPLTCVNNSAFVGDVTVPDGTVLAPGTPFNKTWRVRNSGTCNWGDDEELVFVSGEAMTTKTTLSVPATASGGTVDLTVAMTAPEAPGLHSGTWRLRSRGGAIFGTRLNVTINVPGPTAINTPRSCSSAPTIESFIASPTTITLGQSAVLRWGAVTGAERAEIDNDIGGVPTPGSVAVNPNQTTTYTLTAVCGDKTKTAQVTITVNPPTAPTATATPTNTPTRTPTATPKP